MMLALAVAAVLSAPPPRQTPPPSPPPATGQTAPAQPALTMSFRADAKVGFINLQLIFDRSKLGQQGLGRMKALHDKLQADLADRNKEIQDLSSKIQSQQTVVGEATLTGWRSELDRLQRAAQFAREDAQAQAEQLQQQVLGDFEERVRPIVEAIRAEKGLWMIFAVQPDPGGVTLAASDPSLDLSGEVVKRLDAQK
ncbi:MAG TPA: OmpH family outer membrane protein [Vicinamibacterales bacterium]|nr:OmpH family outer membrane protein [Vicinamibacterales bacterium]